MFYSLIKQSNSPEVVISFSTSYNKFTPKQTKDKGGVLTRTFVFSRFDNKSVLNKFNVNDFKLNNILALGAYDMLKPQVMTDTNPLTVIDNVDKVFSESLSQPVISK